MKYKVNWIKTKKGNGIKTGKTLNVEIGNAYIVSGFVAKKTWYGKKMLLLDQGINLLHIHMDYQGHFLLQLGYNYMLRNPYNLL